MTSSYCTPSSSPVPRRMARLMLSEGMLCCFASAMHVRSRGFMSGSPPPLRAAIVSSLMMRVKILPRFASAAPFLCLIVCHLEWPDMGDSSPKSRLSDWKFYHAGGGPAVHPRRLDPGGDVATHFQRHVSRDHVFGRQTLARARLKLVVQGRVEMEFDVRPRGQRGFPLLEVGHGHLIIPLPLQDEDALRQTLRCGRWIVRA